MCIVFAIHFYRKDISIYSEFFKKLNQSDYLCDISDEESALISTQSLFQAFAVLIFSMFVSSFIAFPCIPLYASDQVQFPLVPLVIAVAEVQARNVHPRLGHRHEHPVVLAGRAYRTDDFYKHLPLTSGLL